MTEQALAAESVLTPLRARPEQVFGGDAGYVGGQAVFADGAGQADAVRVVVGGIVQSVGGQLGDRPGQTEAKLTVMNLTCAVC